MRHLLVFAERDDAEEVAETVAEEFPRIGVPAVVREALAGEDDAEDAQWVVVVEDPGGVLRSDHLARLETLAEEHDGWRERW
ncbi:hypothetical protein OHA77_36610 [Streptosporangium sp. NBC_01639]|uniref:hypothetical protein n=1 Tax=unclassified Streptosporangium TaxID=2632669 RepID=UPI002DDBB13E|nr:hypothetical protein [Streptosporangium sp. NBC_01756]WSC87226.1 hypothetical protein OIE48_03115 [Streptosporangium sp. NBC_01756]WTD54084.1 hypothetical protein OHA77_36610 [Streptosporangium sp. NBC_01639]